MELTPEYDVRNRGMDILEKSALLDELAFLGESPPRGDPIIGAYCIALHQIAQTQEYGVVIDNFLEDHPGISPSYAQNKLLRPTQAYELRTNPDYPHGGFDNPNRWLRTFETILDDPENFGNFFIDSRRNVASNVSERYKAIKLIMLTVGERFETAPNILDIGCSQNLGLIRLAASHQRTHDHHKHLDDHAETGSLNTNWIIDATDTSSLKRLLSIDAPIGGSVGIDIMNVEDPLVKGWAKSCSFYPSELFDARKVAQYEQLAQSRSEAVSFFRGDFADFDHAQFQVTYPNKKFGLVTFSTMLYQCSPAERQRMLENAMLYVHPEGVIVIQDFVKTNSSDPHELQFYKNWFARKYRYRTMVLDMREPELGFQELFRWDSGRCEKMKAGRSAARLYISALQREAQQLNLIPKTSYA
jgi:hypothetical protein